ncbi:CPBP family intramembrane glutamic endopeptidase [Microbacterium sediminis]|uniref:Metal-dependent membrane protease n=1 Tax=Microbacterium sediminis TaxID=904291 RepID=A0A1B9NJ45_9MICO|nr:CPBP family intramembrane glutamic endopeptidase [Microbacterium sediminis]OCG76590.1 metal-dependent membrane protease [Microbacterium sediminis]QBR73806.1 CPBP family intramembrane metalloprotease [Microbacterium sediminis]
MTTPGPTPQARVPWNAVSLFTAIVLLLGWLVVLPLWVGAGAASPLAPLLASAMMWTPAVATLIVVAAMKIPRRDVWRFLGVWPLRPWRRTVGFAIGALLGPIAITLLVVAVSAWFGLVELDLVHFSGFAAQLAASGVDPAGLPLGTIVLTQLLTVPIAAVVPNALLALGEEIGWRGWLLTALRPWGTWPALVLTGVIWGLWHAPLILLGHNFGRTDVTGVLLMIGGCVAWGVLLGWTRLRTGSVWPAVFAHGALNAVGGIVLVLAEAGQPIDLAVVGPLGLVAWAVIAVIVAVMTAAGAFRDAGTDAQLGERPAGA